MKHRLLGPISRASDSGILGRPPEPALLTSSQVMLGSPSENGWGRGSARALPDRERSVCHDILKDIIFLLGIPCHPAFLLKRWMDDMTGEDE